LYGSVPLNIKGDKDSRKVESRVKPMRGGDLGKEVEMAKSAALATRGTVIPA
jgi:hypothetical protein